MNFKMGANLTRNSQVVRVARTHNIGIQKLGGWNPCFSSHNIGGQLFVQDKQLSAMCKSSTFISNFIAGYPDKYHVLSFSQTIAELLLVSG